MYSAGHRIGLCDIFFSREHEYHLEVHVRVYPWIDLG